MKECPPARQKQKLGYLLSEADYVRLAHRIDAARAIGALLEGNDAVIPNREIAAIFFAMADDCEAISDRAEFTSAG